MVELGNANRQTVKEWQTAEASNPIEGKTPQEIDAWIEVNVIDLPTSKIALKHMARVLVVHEKQLEVLELLLKKLL